jgi:hypothetical protein
MAYGKSIPPHYPSGWSDEFISGDIARFGARFRIASAFEGLSFKIGISKETAVGYSGIIHTFLAYTAYEKFSKTFGLGSDKKRAQIEAIHTSRELYESIYSKGRECKSFLKFLESETDSKSLRKNIEALLNKKEFSIILTGEAIRHAFAHGNLTPSSWKSDPKLVGDFCQLISSFLVKVMDSESKGRIQGIKKKR